MQKHEYQMSFNKGKLMRNPVNASFGQSKAIQLHICHEGIVIVLNSSAMKDSQKILQGEDTVLADATRNALTIYAIRYGRFLNVTSAEVVVDGVQQQIFKRRISDPPLIYSLSEGSLRPSFGRNWRKPGVEAAIACTSKSNYDGRHIALHALMAAKSDRYEIERFTYYWMAMNGLYGYVAKQSEAYLNKKAVDAEFKQMAFLARCYGHEPCSAQNGDNLPRKHVRQIMWHTAAVLKRIPETEIDSFCIACLEEDQSNRHLQRIYNGLTIEDCDYRWFSAFSLMVLLIPYKIRCESFHAGNALPTFCYKDDAELKVLRVTNRILDRFLTQELALWLDTDDDAEGMRQMMLRQALENHVYDKWRT